MKKQTKKAKKAFTLAEVLIALSVLSLLIVLTVPTLIITTSNKTYVDGFLRADVMLKQATAQIMINNGGTLRYLISSPNHDLLRDKYCTVLNCIKKCDVGTAGCFDTQTSAKVLGSNMNLYYDPSQFSSAILSNGMLLLFDATGFPDSDAWGNTNTLGSVHVDINGFKGPNVLGRDIFDFVLKRNNYNGIVPMGSIQDDPDYVNGIRLDCQMPAVDDPAYDGSYCGARIVQDGNRMNY